MDTIIWHSVVFYSFKVFIIYFFKIKFSYKSICLTFAFCFVFLILVNETKTILEKQTEIKAIKYLFNIHLNWLIIFWWRTLHHKSFCFAEGSSTDISYTQAIENMIMVISINVTHNPYMRISCQFWKRRCLF